MKIQFTRNIVSLIVALALGGLAVILLNVNMAKEKARLKLEREKQLGQEVSVIVAKEDIPRGTKITSRYLQTAYVREVALQPRVITRVEEAIGKVAVADILSGEQVSATKLMSGQLAPLIGREGNVEPSSGSLAMKIPSGKRAFTMSLDEVSAAGGMLKPNDYVDIMGMFPFTQQIDGKAITQNVSVMLFQNVMVLAVGKDFSSQISSGTVKPMGGSTITVALIPQQVELLNFAQELGRIRLILRPPLETQIQAIPPVTSDILWQQIIQQAGMQLPEKGQAAVEKRPSATVEVYRGKTKEVMPLD